KTAGTQTNDEIELLKAQLAAQQSEISELRKAVDDLGDLIKDLRRPKSEPATPLAPVSIGIASSDNKQTDRIGEGATGAGQSGIVRDDPSPLSFRIGNVDVTPLASLELTGLFRSKNVGSGVGTSFGAIPYDNTVNGNLSETRFTAQKIRLGFRVDARVRQMDILGFVETDFLGFSPSNVAVNSNSDTLRLRLGWVDIQKNKIEILAGQSWSMLTPNRKGLSPLPQDIFLGQGLDSNYHIGLTWSRNPQFRVVYHPSNTVTLGWSLEASEQYAGGAGGSGAITLPSGLVASYGPQLNTGNSTFGVPNPHLDSIAKIAFDPKFGSRAVHFEVAGLLSRFEFYNPLSKQKFTATGGGVAVNGNLELFKNFRLIGNSFYNEGGGRWLFGQGPDLIIRGNGSPELVRSASTIDGVEYQVTPKTMIYGYYGGDYFDRTVTIDPANGEPVGFGYTGSPSDHNRSIQQATFGVNYMFWQDRNYGSMQFLSQYSYLIRHPWFVVPGQPRSANLNMIYLTFRYTLPGASPKEKK
ncbi:MAG TPA: hypothetical protein VHQ01_07230, partial [Pyrinomonadaceae bacterium]|nr:hypothetical protein [Pyrinomonadaceae bacterium]